MKIKNTMRDWAVHATNEREAVGGKKGEAVDVPNELATSLLKQDAFTEAKASTKKGDK